MSYSVSLRTNKIKKSEICTAETLTSTPDYAQEESLEHIAVAMEVVSKIAQIVGLPEDEIMFTISGHANEGHASNSSWSDEFMTVSVHVRAK